jgi:hypothetical protein
MEFVDDDDFLASIDPQIHAIVSGANHRDRRVLPALREQLEQALALFTDATSATQSVVAAVAGLPESARVQAITRVMMPMTLFDDLVLAAIRMPDASLEPVLKALSQRLSHEGVREALSKVRALIPSSKWNAKVKPLSIPNTKQSVGDGSLATLVRNDDYKGVLDAIPEALIGDLLAGLGECIASDKRFQLEALVNACQRYPESEVLFVVRPWITDADPGRRQAVAMALGREGEDDIAPDRRVIDQLYRLLADREPDVVVAALWAIGRRTSRNFTPSDLARMRSQCERHASVKVREAYSDVFYSPYVGHGPATGACEAWCRLTRDEDPRQRYLAGGRLRTFLWEGEEYAYLHKQISAALNAAKADASANVRFEALAGLTELRENHSAQIERELTDLADQLELSNIGDRTGDEDDGLGLILEMVKKPNRRYVSALERIVNAFKAADPGSDTDCFDTLVEECRQAPREGFLSRFLPI